MDRHKHFCIKCGEWIVEAPMVCPEFDNKDHAFGFHDACAGRDKYRKDFSKEIDWSRPRGKEVW